MGKFMHPFTDMGFKRIFGQEINKDLLITFLNDLLVGEKQIVDIRFLDKEIVPEVEGDRGVIYDVYCTTESGEHFIVEMQNRQQVNFKERALYYLSQAVSRQGLRGSHWMFDLKAVYGVFFINFPLGGRPEKLKKDIILTDRETHELFTDKLRFIFIELPSFNKTMDECETDFECWIYVLKYMDKLERLPFKSRKAIFEKLEEIAQIAALSEREQMMYDESIKVYRDNLATIAYAKQEGLSEGFEKGMEEGMEKGIEKGMEKGRADEKVSIARKMKGQGISSDVISSCTGLSIDEISAL